MKFFLFFIIFVTLFSCKTKKEEIVDFNDLSEGSKKNYEQDSSEIKEDESYFYDSFNLFSKDLIDSLKIDKKLIFKLDTILFPDRFGAMKVQKWYQKTEKDSLVFFHWEFKDSIKTYNTFYNWLDCFGKNCRSIRVGDKIAFSKRATLFLIQDKHLFFIESNLPIDYQQYLNYFDSKKWPQKWKFIVNQKPRKKAEWINRELIEIAK